MLIKTGFRISFPEGDENQYYALRLQHADPGDDDGETPI
jgi:hypothetical protein